MSFWGTVHGDNGPDDHSSGLDTFGKGGAGGQWNSWGTISGQDGKNQKSQDAKDAAAAQNQAMGGVYQGMDDNDKVYADQMGQNGKTYLSSTGQVSGKYTQKLDDLANQSQMQMLDGQSTYTNTIRPNMVNAMEGAKKDAGDAMSLKDAGDANNSVNKGVRDMYEQQAQGVGRQGLADAGVLAAMGAQATQGQMGSTPMTGGQMAAMAGQNQSQSGQAYMNAQSQMQNLRSQGIDAGFRESAAQYDRGQGAKDRYQQTIGNLQNAQGINQNQQSGFRQEQNGYAGQKMQTGMDTAGRQAGVANGMAGLANSQYQGHAARQTNLVTGKYDPQIQAANAGIAQIGATQGGMIGAAGTIAGGVLGGMAAGPAGAATGAAAGNQWAGGNVSQSAQTGGNYQGTAGYYGRTA